MHNDWFQPIRTEWKWRMIGCLAYLFPDEVVALENGEWTAPMDCLRASEMCNQNAQCSSRFRIMRQCLVGRDRSAMLENKECQAALEVLQDSPLHHCHCKRGMKKELQCLQSYWTIHMSLNEGKHQRFGHVLIISTQYTVIFLIFLLWTLQRNLCLIQKATNFQQSLCCCLLPRPLIIKSSQLSHNFPLASGFPWQQVPHAHVLQHFTGTTGYKWTN